MELALFLVVQLLFSQIVRWKNSGYEIIHVKSGSMTINLTINGEIKQVELHQGDTILLAPSAQLIQEGR